MTFFSGQDYLNWVYVENSNDDLSDLTLENLRTRRRQLQGELARALAVLGINGPQFHGLASRKKIDEVRMLLILSPKIVLTYCEKKMS